MNNLSNNLTNPLFEKDGSNSKPLDLKFLQKESIKTKLKAKNKKAVNQNSNLISVNSKSN